MNKIKQTNELRGRLKELSGFQPKGQERLERRLEEFAANGECQLFIPWAASFKGRTELNDYDVNSLNWLFGKKGFISELAGVITVQTTVMLADIYARRNGIDMSRAEEYWENATRRMSEVSDVRIVRTSQLEDEEMTRFRAEEAYAYERLQERYYGLPRTAASKILEAAQKYSGAESSDVYESAAEYTMLRAAEGRYVDEQMGALWVSLNWPERDIMCEDIPRIYVPESIRAPWLK